MGYPGGMGLETIFGIGGKILSPAGKAASWTYGMLWGIRVEVEYLTFDDAQSSPVGTANEILGFITTAPRRYFLEVVLTNRTASTVYIRSVRLLLKGKVYESDLRQPLKLGAKEPVRQTLIFPLENGDDPIREGDYILQVIPSVGRKVEVCGKFPVRSESA